LQGLGNWRTVLHIGSVRFTEVKVLPLRRPASPFCSNAEPLPAPRCALVSPAAAAGNPNPAATLSAVIPAKAGIQHLSWFRFLQVQSFHSPFGRASYLSLLVQRKVTERNTPQVARLPGILPFRFARGLRGSLNAHPCACSELARILRTILRTFPPPPRRATGAPFRRHPAAEAVAGTFFTTPSLYRSEGWYRRSAGMHEFVQDRRRWRRRASQGAVEIARRGARVGCEHMDVLSADPAVPEKHRAVRFARCESDRRVRCLDFLVTFWALRRRSGANSEAGRAAAKGRMPGVMPKVTRSPQARRSSALEEQSECKELDSGLRRNDELQRRAKPGLKRERYSATARDCIPR
jgi:hypothetical protein